MLSKVMAGCLGLAAFAIAIFAGLAAGNDAGPVLVRALMAMILCYPVGFIVGMICERVVSSRAEAHEQSDNESGDPIDNLDAQAAPSEEVTIV